MARRFETIQVYTHTIPMTLQTHTTILMTGAAGGLGVAMRPKLKQNCQRLRLSDLAPMAAAGEHEEVVQADLADAAAVQKLVQGCQAIVHFGGVSTEQPWPAILQANIIGAYNLYEAARIHGVKRIVFASSNHVMGFYRQSEVVDAFSPPRPDGFYGLSKAFGEDLSRLYFDRHGIETACVRIGSSFPEPKDRRMLATWLSYDDLHRLIVACLSTPVLGHSIIYGTSNNSVSWYDNRHARHIGFVPQDSSDRFRQAVFASTSEPDLNDPAVQFQGGGFVRLGPR
jgi:uronate dehydrogenase